jgi:glycine dehydrogenase subunit 1
MALLGPQGLKNVAAGSHAGLQALLRRLRETGGVRPRFGAPLFHEAALAVDLPADAVLASLREEGIVGGLDLADDYPELQGSMLVCVTETKTPADLDRFVNALNGALAGSAGLQGRSGLR